MMPTLSFENAFWSPKQPDATLPDFQTGLQALHAKLNQSKIENDQVIAFVKERIAIEEMFASRLVESTKANFKSSGFGRDEGAGLKLCFNHVRSVVNGQIGQRHKQLASNLNEDVLKPLQKFQEEYKRSITNGKQSIDAALKQFDALAKEMERARSVYFRKCREADDLAPKQSQQGSVSDNKAGVAPPSPATSSNGTSTPELKEDTQSIASIPSPPQPQDTTVEPTDVTEERNKTTVTFGNQSMTLAELDKLVARMRSEIHVGDHRVPILGKYPNTSTGESISAWLQQNLPQCKDSPAMADVVAQQLIHPLGVLRLVGQRGNRFSPSATSFYQWRQREDDSANTTNTSSSLGGFFERFGSITTSTSPASATNAADDLYRKAQRDATAAYEAYQSLTKRLDQLRMVVEQSMFAHFTEMEQTELKRLGTLKQIFGLFTTCFSDLKVADKALIDEMLMFQEALKPDQDIQYIIQQYGMAGYSPRPILCENYYTGVAQEQIFGVPLQDLGKQTENKVPKFVNCLLEAIHSGAAKLQPNEKDQLWHAHLPLDRVHAVRGELNIPSEQMTTQLLEQYEPVVLVAILRLYLLELPECLMTYDFYDAAQALYSNNEQQDDSLRLLPLGNLVATLPSVHFETLRAILQHIHELLDTENDKQLLAISQSFGPVILHTRIASVTSLTNRVPIQIARDLIKHFPRVFSDATLESHAENEKRRNAQLLKADVAVNDVSAKQQRQLQQPKRAGSLMSFMRPAEDSPASAKWGVRGVFQRNNTASTTSSNSSTSSMATGSEPRRSSSSSVVVPMSAIHFSSSAITHGSPPPSPKMKHKPLQESSEVMFDLAREVKRDGIEAGDDDLDPFFDDD